MRRLDYLGTEFDDFVRDASPGLLRLAVLMTQDRGASEDLVQQCLVRTAGRWRAARARPHAYARQVLVNLVRNRHRDRSRRPREVSAESTPHQSIAAVDDTVVEREAVSRMLAELPEGQRSIVVLRYFADLPVAEVAQLLGCSEGNVKSQTSRALASLRGRLAAASDDPTERQSTHAHR